MTQITQTTDDQAEYIAECFKVSLEQAREITKAVAARKARKKR